MNRISTKVFPVPELDSDPLLVVMDGYRDSVCVRILVDVCFFYGHLASECWMEAHLCASMIDGWLL